MSQTKKLLSLLLAIMMVFCLSVSAMAAGEEGEAPTLTAGEGPLDGGTITINNAVPGTTYKAYQVLYVESYDSTNNVYSYKATSAWKEWLKDNASAYLAINPNTEYVTWVALENETADQRAARAKELADLLKGANINPVKIETAPNAAEGSQNSTVTMSGLKLGYYFVDTNLGSLCSLDTTNAIANIQEKNEVPTNEKKVEEDSDKTFYAKNDSTINQIVKFKSTIAAKEGAQKYVFHDTMSSGLSFVDTTEHPVTVYKNPTVDSITGQVADSDTPIASSNYAVNQPTGEGADGCTFEVVFTDEFCNSLTDNDTIVIIYYGKLNANAVIAGDGNFNESKLSYGEDSRFETTPSKTVTKTWEFDVLKYATINNQETGLANAEFELLEAEDGPAMNLVKVTDGSATEQVTKDIYRVAVDSDAAADKLTTIKTNASGMFEIEGLDSGTYYLKETKQPQGYNLLKDAVVVTISDTGKVNATAQNPEGVTQVKIENNSGTELPSTGGMGTTLLYVGGGILVAAAAILLIFKKRMSVEK